MILGSASASADAQQDGACASCSEVSDDWQRWSVLGHFALFGSPQGGIGIEVEHGLREYLVVSGSVGATETIHAALALRLRAPLRVGSFRMFAGVSGGGSYGSGFDGGHVAVNATWLTGDTYLETRSDRYQDSCSICLI